jgi:DNA-binding response OmpR family regulator
VPTHRVLVVEVDESAPMMLQEGLQSDRFEVSVASNERNALELIATGVFDLLLSELHMPLEGGASPWPMPYASGRIDCDPQRTL